MSGFVSIRPSTGPIDAIVRPPGSKSQTIRALFIAGLATGTSHLHHALEADDTSHAREALRALGIEIDDSGDTWTISGSEGWLHAPDRPVSAGASGLTARILIAVASLIDGETTVTGLDRLPSRPMGGLIEALRQLGVTVTADGGGTLPVTVTGTGRLPGGMVDVDSRLTTQFVTALLVSAPLAEADVAIAPIGLDGSSGYIDVTVETMRRFGAEVGTRDDGRLIIHPTGYRGTDLDIEPDASAAVYPMVAAAITGGRVVIEGLGVSSSQPDLAIAGYLETMGCQVELGDHSTVVVGPTGALHPIDADLSPAPDGALALAVAALFADGTSRLRGLGSLRHKESDRLAALGSELTRLGATTVVDGDDLVITPGEPRPARVETYDDHRMAMSFAVGGLRIPGLEISNPAVVTKTWPGFWEMLERISRPI